MCVRSDKLCIDWSLSHEYSMANYKERRIMEPKDFLETIRNKLDEAYVEDDKDKIKELEGMYHGARTMYEIREGGE